MVVTRLQTLVLAVVLGFRIRGTPRGRDLAKVSPIPAHKCRADAQELLRQFALQFRRNSLGRNRLTCETHSLLSIHSVEINSSYVRWLHPHVILESETFPCKNS